MSLGLGEIRRFPNWGPLNLRLRISHFVVEVVPLCFNTEGNNPGPAVRQRTGVVGIHETDPLLIESDCLPLGRLARRHGH
jgi:hypothetical protein